jgi:hypothetical protein
MDLQKIKLELIKEILEVENHVIIEKVLNFLKKEKVDLEILNEETTDYETSMSSRKNAKLDFINDYINLDDKETISEIENVLWKKNDFWNELSSSQKDEINLGVKQLDEGKKYSYESVLKEIF